VCCKSLKYLASSLTLNSVFDYTSSLVREWTETFYGNTGIKQDFGFYIEAARKLIADFAIVATDKVIYPELALELDLLKSQFEKANDLVPFKTGKITADLDAMVRDCHRVVAAPAVKKYLEPMYAKCAAQRGKQWPFYMMPSADIPKARAISAEIRRHI